VSIDEFWTSGWLQAIFIVAAVLAAVIAALVFPM